MLEKFERKEIKYLITIKQYLEIKKLLEIHMKPDTYHKSTIKNIYYDTNNYLLIRKSIEKPKYKEKLRIRSYGIKSYDDYVFIELKKKYDGIVYKRRIKMKYKDAIAFLNNSLADNEIQVLKEIKYFIKYYDEISPKIMLTYDREAYKETDSNFRLTFDSNILWRDNDIDLTKECYGNKILSDNQIIMEAKSSMGFPKWFVDFLSTNKIYKISFSKYGNVYKEMKFNKIEEKIIC